MNKCFVCGESLGLHRHHLLGGCRRTTSEKYGLVVYLCFTHHDIVTNEKDRELTESLHRYAQLKFQKEHPELDFMKTFNKNYL